jgi:hypothetical protein
MIHGAGRLPSLLSLLHTLLAGRSIVLVKNVQNTALDIVL